MGELLQKILTDTSARDAADMPELASQAAENYLPWASE